MRHFCYIRLSVCLSHTSHTFRSINIETIRYDTIEEFNVDLKAEYSALSSTRSQKKKLKQTTPVQAVKAVR